ncbi:MAG TPA: hypothetical protein VFF06_10685, partial [Polyangia bacterium]|nr:hypothetical protein [Polyangia bacterium]
PDTDEARKRVAALTERLRREQPPPAPSAPAPPPKRLRVPAIVVGAAAVVAFAVGGGLYGSAAADFPARKSYCASLPRECVPSEWSDLAARSNAAYALFAIGGALAAADVVLWVIDLKRSRAARAQLSPAANGFVVRF